MCQAFKSSDNKKKSDQQQQLKQSICVMSLKRTKLMLFYIFLMPTNPTDKLYKQILKSRRNGGFDGDYFLRWIVHIGWDYLGQHGGV